MYATLEHPGVMLEQALHFQLPSTCWPSFYFRFCHHQHLWMLSNRPASHHTPFQLVQQHQKQLQALDIAMLMVAPYQYNVGSIIDIILMSFSMPEG